MNSSSSPEYNGLFENITDIIDLTNDPKPSIPNVPELSSHQINNLKANRSNEPEYIKIGSPLDSPSYSPIEFLNGFDLDEIKSSIDEIQSSNKNTQESCEEIKPSPVIELYETKKDYNPIRTLRYILFEKQMCFYHLQVRLAVLDCL